MKLSAKINLLTSILFAILLIIMNVSIYITFSTLTYSNATDAAEEELRNTAVSVGRLLGDVPEADLLRAYIPVNGMIQIVGPGNKSLSSVTSPNEKGLAKRKPRFFSGEHSTRIEFDGNAYTFQSTPIILPDGEIGNLQITSSLKAETGILRMLGVVLAAATLAAFIPVAASSAFLGRLITRPVTSMTRTMSEIRRSGEFKRLDVEGKSKDELYEMRVTFNHMIDLLQENFEKQQQFAANASHELKTPLTIIESYSSLLKRRGLQEPELFGESIDAIHSEAVRMRELTEQLLLIATNTANWELKVKEVDLPFLLHSIAKTFENAYSRDIIFKHSGQSASIKTDEQKLRQLLFILLDNARKYSDEPITVELVERGNQLIIQVIDSGIGIPREDLPNVFDRFFRVEKARSRKMGGSGLGLSLAKEIADALGIGIRLDSMYGKGTTASLIFSNVSSQ